jgi:hypothetical protein
MQTIPTSHIPNAFNVLRIGYFRVVFWFTFSSIVAALITRTLFGIDFGDEAYYVTFIVQWLKTGIATSSFLTIHQTAALLPFVVSRFFVYLSGSSDGLVLFLRLLFVALSAGVAILWFIFLSRVANQILAGLSALLVLSFVPFGLPSPSYNTLGMQALTLAIACLGCALTTSSRMVRLRYQLASALSWSIGIVAYPTLGIVAATLIAGLVLRGNRTFPQSRSYAVMVAFFSISGVIAAISVLTLDKVIGSVRYLNMINDVSGISEKFERTTDLLAANPIPTTLFAASAAVGFIRSYIKTYRFAFTVAVVIATGAAFPAALFVRSHDIIFILALSGLGLFRHLNTQASLERRTVAICYSISMFAGAITVMTATNGLYNFCIGGLPAAALALASLHDDIRRPDALNLIFAALALIAAIAIVLSTSLFYFYGEPSFAVTEPRERVESGVFKLLMARREDRALLQQVQTKVNPIIGQSTLAIFSVGHPGIALETNASIKMLTIFPLQVSVPKAGLKFTHDYYLEIKNRPEYVIVFQDGGNPNNAMDQDFDAWYQRLETLTTPLGPLSVFRRQ